MIGSAVVAVRQVAVFKARQNVARVSPPVQLNGRRGGRGGGVIVGGGRRLGPEADQRRQRSVVVMSRPLGTDQQPSRGRAGTSPTTMTSTRHRRLALSTLLQRARPAGNDVNSIANDDTCLAATYWT